MDKYLNELRTLETELTRIAKECPERRKNALFAARSLRMLYAVLWLSRGRLDETDHMGRALVLLETMAKGLGVDPEIYAASVRPLRTDGAEGGR